MEETLNFAALFMMLVFWAAAAIFVIWLILQSISCSMTDQTKDSIDLWIARDGDGRLFLYTSRPGKFP